MKLHLLPSITLLPPPHETADDAQIIEDWARGLDWVKWLLSSVRARTEVLMVQDVAWDNFADGVLRETIGPALKSAWQAAQAGDLAGLIAADERLSAQLPAELARRSIQAGAVLLKSTRHARYQAVLGRFREAVGQGSCTGHIAIVWAAVGHFFQLSLTNVIAEYLHLEWDIATRDLEPRAKPTGNNGIAVLTSQVMRGTQAGEALSVVARR
jgi:urease accessory protein UreF